MTTKEKEIENKLEELKKYFVDIELDFYGDEDCVVVGIMENRYIFKEFVKIIENNSEINKSNLFLDYIRINYINTIIIAILRQIDKHKDSKSLISFLYNIYNNTELITKEHFISQYSNVERGNRDFEENFGNLKYIDPGIVYKDIENLLFCTKEIRNVRNKRIAHKDKGKVLFEISFNVLDKAVDLMDDIFKKYYLLLGQNDKNCVVGLPSSLLCFRGGKSCETDIFRVPWIK